MDRIVSIDVVKVFAVFAIIMIHANPSESMLTENDIYGYSSLAMNQLSRFAVPFFFVMSGYFWGYKVRNNVAITIVSIKVLKRLFVIFIVWSFIYLLPYNLGAIFEYGLWGPIKVIYWNIEYLRAHPINLLFQGTKGHLWFLVSLMNAVIITSLFLYKKWEKGLIAIALILYMVGLFAKAYVNTPIGIHFDFNTRNGPFFSTIFFVTGYIFSKYKSNTLWFIYGIFLFLGGCVMHFSEIYFICKYYNVIPYQDFCVGTYFMGIGVSLIALSNHPVLNVNMIGRIGQYALGIYVVHFIFIDSLEMISKVLYNPVLKTGYVVLIMFLSLGTVVLMSKNKYLRMIVM